ncbi:hypothetical protein N0V88_002197 [Collariella sp. IMI 366227]|nr:hypothetical protein N0V88_002197 [Collariella sp. IMI 366227]
MSTIAYDCDVLVVGAGPVGGVLALELAMQGVSFRIIDSAPWLYTLAPWELLNRHGAADSLIQRGRILRGGSVFINKQLAASLDLDDLGVTDTEFALPLNISQVETESFLDECLAKYGLNVERPVTATTIVQDDNGVATTVQLPNGQTKTILSKYVVGCDGAHSVVRHASSHMTFEGDVYPQDFILCDVQLHDSNLNQNRLTLYLSNEGILAILPLRKGIVRIVASRNPTFIKEQSQDIPTLPQLQSYFTLMTPPGSGTLHDPIWLTRFRLHHRCVNQYRDGPSALLDTYNLERRPVGLALLRGTDKIFSFVSSPSPWWVPFRNWFLRHVLPRVNRSRERRRRMFLFITQLG